LAEVHRVAEEEDFGGGGGFLELCGFVGKDFAGEAVFARDLERIGVLLLRRMEREGENGLPRRCRIGGEHQESDIVFAGERIRRRVENGNIVLRVDRDDGSLHETRGAVGPADKNVGLAAVAEGLNDVGGGEEVALFVDEEAVAKETVVIAARGWRLVKLINDRADGGRRNGIVSRAF